MPDTGAMEVMYPDGVSLVLRFFFCYFSIFIYIFDDSLDFGINRKMVTNDSIFNSQVTIVHSVDKRKNVNRYYGHM